MAPLKHGFQFRGQRADLMFPRLKRRGPIEACLLFIRMGIVCLFPRLKRRGPIEAVHASAFPVQTLVRFHV